MKLGKYILGLALVAAGLTSCDQDNVGAIYEPTQANISFISAEQSAITEAESLTVPVAIGRATTNGTYTATVNMSNATDGVSLKSDQVTFADGEGMAYAIVEIANMQKGKNYSCTLTLSDADAATANTEFGKQVTSTTVNVMCDYNWISLGNGFYSSPDFWEEEFYVPVQHAEGTNIYRLIGLFQSGYNIDFTIEGEKVYVASQPSWFYNASYGDVYLVGDANDNADGYAGTYDAATKTVTFILYHYIPGVGSFGTFVDTLTMP